MRYFKDFIQCIRKSIPNMDVYAVDEMAYMLKEEAEVYIGLSFDLFDRSSDLRLYASAGCPLDDLMIMPSGALVGGNCYDINEYACKNNAHYLSNKLEESENGQSRYTTQLIKDAFDKNLTVFKETMLADIEKIDTYESYFDFRIKNDHFGYGVNMPCPGIDTFYAAILLKREATAADMYRVMLKDSRMYKTIREINGVLHIDSTDHIFQMLEKEGYLDLEDSDYAGARQMEKTVIQRILQEKARFLKAEAERRLEGNRKIYQQFVRQCK